MTTTTTTESRRLSPIAVLLLVAVTLFLTSITSLAGRPLTVHESVLPQTARTMYADGDYVIPKRADVPWIENPPLPQWITVGLCSAAGQCDQVWVARLGAGLMATWIVLLVAWMASLWFGSAAGLLSGLTTATSYHIVRYGALAEDEIYLAAMVVTAIALFVKIEFALPQPPSRGIAATLFGRRSPWVWAFFVFLGLTNLTKGLLFGFVLAVVPTGAYLLANFDLARITRMLWLWGALLVVAIALAWPLFAWLRQPDAVEVWRYDLLGRLTGDYTAINEPWWYYLAHLPEATAPWILLAPLGFLATARAAILKRYSPERFLWIWALLVPAVLSIPGGKHHHYLLPAIAPWAILATLGMLWLWAKLAGPNRSPRRAAAVTYAVLVGLYTVGQVLHRGTSHQDAEFVQRVAATVPADSTLVADMEIGGLDGFQVLYYLPESALALHNLSFLADDRIETPTAHVVTLDSKRARVEQFGSVREVMRSERTKLSGDTPVNLVLYELTFGPDVTKRASGGVRVSPMQAMYRAQGPYLQ
jgi:4-amino-4-deoxy-L-arabinose transferase-like glycosyltransferase